MPGGSPGGASQSAPRSTRAASAALARRASRSTRATTSSLRATTISAAADGVGARRSATRSATVVSVSWPTAEMTGMGHGGDRARHHLLVEGPEVLDRASAPAHNHDFDARHPRDRLQAPRDVRRGPLALHAGGADDHPDVRVAAVHDLEDVAQRGPVEGGHDADLRGHRRQGALAGRLEEPFCLKPLLELLDSELQRPQPARLETVAHQLVLALGLYTPMAPLAMT